MTETELAELRQRVDDLTAVVAQLTKTKLFNNSGSRNFMGPNTLTFDDLGLRGPAQARQMMVERGLVSYDPE